MSVFQIEENPMAAVTETEGWEAGEGNRAWKAWKYQRMCKSLEFIPVQWHFSIVK